MSVATRRSGAIRCPVRWQTRAGGQDSSPAVSVGAAHDASLPLMATIERSIDRGTRMGRVALVRLGHELRSARIDHGLSIDFVAAASGLSNAEVGRIERALSPNVPFITLARLAAVVGLDLAARFYPGPGPVRDAARVELLADFHALLHPTVRWAVEVPFPIAGDQRAWDGMVAGQGWRYGTEAETAPRDGRTYGNIRTRRSPLDAGFVPLVPCVTEA
jgi:transcriptional regulator with XRE-family HTH domain